MTNHQLFSLPVFSAFTIAQYYSYVARGVFLSFGISPWVETLMNKVDFTVLSDTRVFYFCLEKTFLARYIYLTCLLSLLISSISRG
ncbi:hypothetical protein DFJ43DRAFT_1224510 [Lentinula guzmanii]|uniref:Uncharacterized protein n=1 Tax=Lentinula guzmanii TaxID=2804957 RepID=A0AA38JR15_9AGAR|nr:hypothetical protein DFJ43DRAFT_1224510 [Lentinula guzmanii]